MGAYEVWLVEEAKELAAQRGRAHREQGCAAVGCKPDYPALYLDTDYFYENETDERNNRAERAELRRIFEGVWRQVAHPRDVKGEGS